MGPLGYVGFQVSQVSPEIEIGCDPLAMAIQYPVAGILHFLGGAVYPGLGHLVLRGLGKVIPKGVALVVAIAKVAAQQANFTSAQ